MLQLLLHHPHILRDRTRTKSQSWQQRKKSDLAEFEPLIFRTRALHLDSSASMASQSCYLFVTILTMPRKVPIEVFHSHFVCFCTVDYVLVDLSFLLMTSLMHANPSTRVARYLG